MKRRESLGLDLTPVIDVVFILLIFFIVLNDGTKMVRRAFLKVAKSTNDVTKS